jgi:hypothetical protein
VNTVEIAGVDTNAPSFRKLKARFRKHAVSPEVAAASILRGIARNDYLVFTSRDIRVVHFLQNKLGFLYERAMRRLQGQMNRARERM